MTDADYWKNEAERYAVNADFWRSRFETQRDLIEQALEDICGAKLCEINSMSSRLEMIRLMDSAISKLKDAKYA